MQTIPSREAPDTNEVAAAPLRTAATASDTNTRGQANTSPTIGKPKILMNSDRYLPKAEQAARMLIASWIQYGPKQANHIDPDMLPGIHAEIGNLVLDALLEHNARNFAGVTAYFVATGQKEGLRAEMIECTQGPTPLPGDCEPLIKTLRLYNHERQSDLLAGELRDTLERGGDTGRIMEKIVEHMKNAAHIEQGDVFIQMLAERVFDADNPPPRPEPILSLAGKCIGTPGNLMAIQAGIKAGKTAVIGAINAGFFTGRAVGIMTRWDSPPTTRRNTRCFTSTPSKADMTMTAPSAEPLAGSAWNRRPLGFNRSALPTFHKVTATWSLRRLSAMPSNPTAESAQSSSTVWPT